MFNRKSFTSFNGQLFGSALINDWKYVTTDNAAALSAADYFSEVQPLLAVGDVIHAYHVSSDQDGNGTKFVTAIGTFIVRTSDREGSHVATLPKHDLDGHGVLANGNVGDNTTIAMSTAHTLTEAHCILSGAVDSAGDGATVTVSNGETLLFSATINNTIANGAVIKMAKDGDAEADDFSAASFAVSTDGGAANAHGIITVVLDATKK
jgi:hypothetical protein